MPTPSASIRRRTSFREKGGAPSGCLRYAPDAEEALELEALRAGNLDALNRLDRRHRSTLYSTIFRFVRDPDMTESLVQETLFQAMRSLHTFRAHSKLSTWLYSIATNVARSALRRERRYKGLDENEVDRLRPLARPGTHAELTVALDPEMIVEQSERSRIVRNAIDRLPETHRTVIKMRYLMELSTVEAAAMLGITEGAVRVRLHRACKALREHLSSRWPELTDS